MTAIKERLVKQIMSINNEDYLQELLTRIQEEQSTVYQLNSIQKKSITAALKDIEAGHTLTEEEIEKELDEWFEK